MAALRLVLPALLLSLLVAGTACAQDPTRPAQEQLTLEQATGAFDAAALRVNDYAAADVARWTGPIYLAIAGYSGMSSVAPEIEAAVRDVARLAKVPVHRVEWSDPRINVRFRPSAGDVGSASTWPCRTSLSWGHGALQHADVTVNLANEGRITRCINHEIMHVFGLRSHAHAAASVLSYTHSNNTRPSAIDRLMIETLYDSRLSPGTSAISATRIACSIMADKLGVSQSERSRQCRGRDLRNGGLFTSLDRNRNRD